MKTLRAKNGSRDYSRQKNHTRRIRRRIGGSSPVGAMKQKPQRRMSFFSQPSSFNLTRSMILPKASIKPGEREDEEFVFSVRPVAKPQRAPADGKIRDGQIAIAKDITSYEKRNASAIISSAIWNSQLPVKGSLQKECIDSNVCMGFGEHRQKIINYFDKFTKFNFVDNSSIKMLGTPSVNGFIIEIKYTRHKSLVYSGYSAYTILKSAREPNSDNLAYEYIVGKFINKHCAARFPCFLQTYGLYYYDSEPTWSLFKDRPKQITQAILKNKITLKYYGQR